MSRYSEGFRERAVQMMMPPNALSVAQVSRDTGVSEQALYNVWRRRNVVGVIDYLDSYASYDRQLSTYAIIGLAMSGHAQANEALQSIQQSPTSEQARLRDGLDDTLETWLEAHDEVAEKGLLGL